MPHFLATAGEQKVKEEYGDYCMRATLRGKKAKPFEEFRRGAV